MVRRLLRFGSAGGGNASYQRRSQGIRFRCSLIGGSNGSGTRPIVYPAAQMAAGQNERQLYRMRAPASGREALAHAEPGAIHLDRETGEEMEPVAMVLPLAPSASALPRTPDNLRACRRCDQLIGLDVSDCPYCGLRQSAL
jgi:hypothetical protein